MDERFKINIFRKKNRYLIPTMIFILFLAFIPVIMSENTAENYSYLIDISACLCLILAVRVFQVHKTAEFRWIGMLAAVWLGLALLGELTWTLEEFSGVEPFPSLADVFWLSAYVPLFYLLYKIIALYKGTLTVSYMKRISLMCFPASLFLVYLGVIIYSWDETALVKVVSLAYVFLDFAAFLLLIVILAAYRRTTLEAYWWIFTLGILCDVVGDYLFSYYDAFDMYYAGSLPDSFFLLSYLVILVGFSMILKTKTIYMSIIPVHENDTGTPQEYDLKKGSSFLVSDPGKAFEILKDLTTHGIDGLGISRTYPVKVRDQYGLEKIPLLWLTNVDSDAAVDPVCLGKLTHIMDTFMQKSDDSVIVLSGIEYLMVHNGFTKVKKFLRTVNKDIGQSKSRLIISLNPDVMDEEQWQGLIKDFKVLDEKLKES
jgi:hypothetical protein